jgi:hypothetical protein
MLASETKKLRWMDIDMRPRWRRRIAVIATYAVFAVLIVCAAAIDSEVYFNKHHVLALLALMLPTGGWLFLSVFRPNGVVKSFDDAPPRKKYVKVGSLDEWARYRYGAAGFEQATEEQQHELLRKYRVGTFPVPAKSTSAEYTALDERERAERDRISRWALNRVAFFLSIMAGSAMADRAPWPPSDVSVYLWAFALLAWTLPQAHVLWTEPDPRDEGEPMLVAKEA